jgi:pyroglutamyl-peptidase
MTILVTGFDRFGELPFNPTQALVEQLAREPPETNGVALSCRVLPTEFDAAARTIETLIRDVRPAVVLGFGVSIRRDNICLERFALNLDDAAIADNAGCIRRGVEIEPGAPAALKTNVDIAAVLGRLGEEGVPAEISNHAGTFVCNHVYYRALRTLATERLRTRCLFVHVPMPTSKPVSQLPTSARPWAMPDLLQATRSILSALEAGAGVRQAATSQG